jgi:UDP-glucose 4-epimerase
MTGRRIVVTGSSGFLGSHLCPLLASQGHSVVGLDVVPPATGDGGFEHRDWTAAEPVPTDLGRVDAVLMLAQSPHYRDFPASASDIWNVNVLGVARVMEAFHGDAPWLFHASTGSVYEPSFEPLDEDAALRRDDPYAASKLAAEDLVRLHGGDWTIGRFFTIYGPGQRGRMVPAIIDRVRNGSPVTLAPSPFDSSDQHEGLRISVALVEDVANLLATMIERAGEGIGTRQTLNIAPRDPVSIRDIAATAGEILDRPPILEASPDPRAGDLVACTRRLDATFHPSWTTLAEGVQRTIEGSAGSAG